METNCDAFVIAPGGIGTLDEFFGALVLKQLDVHHKPIAIFNVDGYYDKMLDLIKHCAEEKFLRENCLGLFQVFNENEIKNMLEYLAQKEYDYTVPVSEYKYG